MMTEVVSNHGGSHGGPSTMIDNESIEVEDER